MPMVISGTRPSSQSINRYSQSIVILLFSGKHPNVETADRRYEVQLRTSRLLRIPLFIPRRGRRSVAGHRAVVARLSLTLAPARVDVPPILQDETKPGTPVPIASHHRHGRETLSLHQHRLYPQSQVFDSRSVLPTLECHRHQSNPP